MTSEPKNQIELIELFSKYHEPLFNEDMSFCRTISCGDCQIMVECRDSNLEIILSSSDIEKFKLNNPEYFI